MADHPSRELIDGYLRGTLPPDPLLEVDAHLASCESCRQAAESDHATAAAVWRSALADGLAIEHPSVQTVGSLRGQPPRSGGSRGHRHHVVDCRSCAAELGDLRSLKAALSVAEPIDPAPARFGWLTRMLRAPLLGTGVLAAVAGVGLIVWALLPQSSGSRTSDVALNPAAAPDARGRARASSPGWRMSNRSIVLHADGGLEGMPSLPESEREAVMQALQGRLPAPTGLREVITKGQTLMGADDARATFAPRAPLATAVESNQPEFMWSSLPGATAYVVSVYDDQFALVLESPSVGGTSWRATTSIPRGRIYSWQIRALTPAGPVAAPKPPAPEARFAVITADEADRIARVRAELPASGLRRAVAYSASRPARCRGSRVAGARAVEPFLVYRRRALGQPARPSSLSHSPSSRLAIRAPRQSNTSTVIEPSTDVFSPAGDLVSCRLSSERVKTREKYLSGNRVRTRRHVSVCPTRSG